MSDKNLKDVTIECIKNPTLRRYIFNTDNPSLGMIRNAFEARMNNIMIMAFFGVFAVWKKYHNDESRRRDDWGADTRSAVNAKRVDDAMKNLYCDNILTQEMMSFVFTEILLESRKNPYTPFRNLIKGKVETTKFSKIAEIIRIWKINSKSREANPSLTIGKELYIEFLESLEILQYMEVDDSNGEVILVINLPEREEIVENMSLFIKQIEVEGMVDNYYLYKAVGRGKDVYLEYINFGGKLIYRQDDDCENILEDEINTKITNEFIKKKDEFKKITCNNLNRFETGNIARSLTINDYKYIHRLSLCVADALRDGTKEDLLEKIKEKNGYWEKYRNEKSDNLNWDNIVVLLMLEFGPSEVLETVLKSDINAFQDILKNITVRFSLTKENAEKIVTYDELVQEYRMKEKEETLYQETMQTEVSKNKKVKSWIKNAKISFMSRFIISKVSEAINDGSNNGDLNEAFYAESITMKLQKINSSISSNGVVASLGMINKTLERVFRTLILFYNGILAYGEEKENQIFNCPYDKRHDAQMLNNMQIACEKAFFKRVKELVKKPLDRETGEYKGIHKATLGMLMAKFENLCKEIDGRTTDRKKNYSEYHKNSVILHSVIGRRHICDLRLYEKIVSANKEDFKDMDGKYPDNIAHFFNVGLKHDDPSINVKDPRIINTYIRYVLDLFEFFDLNDDFKNKGKIAVQNIFDPVFPYVVRYSEKNENRDKCSACQYVINTDGGFDDTKIKLLTEFNYTMNELYYCIPNAECSTENWWVSPFLINCREFDKIILDLEEEDKK